MNYFIVAFAFIIGATCIWMSSRFMKLYARVKKWNRIQAKVISKGIFVHPGYSTTRTPYGLKAEYVYQVDGKDFTGNNIYLLELIGGQVNHMQKDAEKRLSRIGDSMIVFVDPADPKISVMYCKGIGMYIFIFFCGMISLLIGIGHLAS